MKTPKYAIEGDSVDELAAKLVYLLKLSNEQGQTEPDDSTPRVDVMTCICNDGSKVTIRLTRKPKDERCRRGIEIDGARLG